MIQTENKTSFTASKRQQSLRVNDFGFDFVRFTIFDIDYTITDPELFKALFTPFLQLKSQAGNVIDVVYDCPNPNDINWKSFIFANYDAKKKEVMI